METEGQWCDNASCPDCGKIDADNIQMHSYAERRFRCTTCQRTFSADKGTFFETLRTPRPLLLDVVAMLVERNSRGLSAESNTVQLMPRCTGWIWPGSKAPPSIAPSSGMCIRRRCRSMNSGVLSKKTSASATG